MWWNLTCKWKNARSLIAMGSVSIKISYKIRFIFMKGVYKRVDESKWVKKVDGRCEKMKGRKRKRRK